MHVAIVGAGALGRVYGVRLAGVGIGVSFVVRPAKARSAEPMRIERIDGNRATHEIAKPELVASIPSHADVVLVAVRAEQVDAPLEALLEARPAVPIVMMTPLMPAVFERLVRGLGMRVLAAMPGVVAYITDQGVTRYWLPRVAPTLVDEPRPPVAVVNELVHALTASGLPARLELGVHEMNPATTVSFIPLAMAIDAAGGIDPLLSDNALLKVALAAANEGFELSRRIGKSASWVGLLTRFAGPRMIRLGVGLARRGAPEAVSYVETHFGRKLHAQNVAMADAMVDLAHQKGVKSDAIGALRERLHHAVPK